MVEPLPDVIKGGPHVAAHNEERNQLNALLTQLNAGPDLTQLVTKKELEALAPPSRSIIQVTTESLVKDQSTSEYLTMATAYRLYWIQTDRPARVRIYATPGHRDLDVDRPIGTLPTGDHGLIFEYVTTAEQLSAVLTPVVDGANLEEWPTADIPCTITNLDKDESPVKVSLNYIRTE